jgi:dihydrofolate reductase
VGRRFEPDGAHPSFFAVRRLPQRVSLVVASGLLRQAGRMRELILKMSISLDGFVAASDGGGDWMVPSRSPDGSAWVVETLSGAGLHAIGRRSFESFVTFYPTATIPAAAPMNEIPKVVFTRQASFAPSGPGNWGTARVANGDVVEEVERLKQEDGEYILAQAGAGFARSLVRLGLVDEYRLVVHPVALGSGIPLFADVARPAELELVSTTTFTTGALGQVYRPV